MIEAANSILSCEDCELFTSRILDAQREEVFRAFMDPDHLRKWWGPLGFTNTFQEFDPRPGGSWRFVMHGPNGKDYPHESRFLDIVNPERIVLQHVSAPRFVLTITLAEQADKTKITWHMLFESAAVCAAVKPIAVEGNEQNLDRLSVELIKMAGASRQISAQI